MPCGNLLICAPIIRIWRQILFTEIAINHFAIANLITFILTVNNGFLTTSFTLQLQNNYHHLKYSPRKSQDDHSFPPFKKCWLFLDSWHAPLVWSDTLFWPYFTVQRQSGIYHWLYQTRNNQLSLCHCIILADYEISLTWRFVVLKLHYERKSFMRHEN
jgi:hypothetical protein